MKATEEGRARIKVERARRAALLATATVEGVRGLFDELAVLCQDCAKPLLLLVPEARRGAEGGGGFLCGDCGVRRFMPHPEKDPKGAKIPLAHPKG
jgi:hypothetical protein